MDGRALPAGRGAARLLGRRSLLVVHLALDETIADALRRRARGWQEAIERTRRLDECLRRRGEPWRRPSADEAVLVSSRLAASPPRALFRWAEALRADVARHVGVDVSVGIASTRLAARLAARRARPRGVLLLLDGYEASFLAPVPIEEIDELRAEQAAALRRVGVRSVGELARLDVALARKILGAEAPRLVGLARGADAAAGAGGGLDVGLGTLAHRLARRLGRTRLGARGIELRIEFRDGVVREGYGPLAAATASAEELAHAAGRLARRMVPRPEPVAAVRLTATGLVPLEGLPLAGWPRPRELTVGVGGGRFVDRASKNVYS